MTENKSKQGEVMQNKEAVMSSVSLENYTGKTIHKVNPLGMRVLVRIPEESNKTDGGLYLPEGAKENMTESVIAEVVEVASAVDDENGESTNVSGIPSGSFVLIEKSVGVRVPWDEQLRIVETVDVLAIVDRINLT